MSIDDQQLDRLAKLANLDLSVEERDLLRDRLSRVLDYVRQLESLEVDATDEPRAPDSAQAPRQDEPTPCLSREQVLSNAPQPRDGYFQVPSVLPREQP